MSKFTSLKTDGLDFYRWSLKNPAGKIPKEVAKEGAGESRVPFAHFANSVPVYLVTRRVLKTSSKKSVKILDLGCGTGRNISFVKETLKSKNYSFFGIDYSIACINFAQNQYKRQGVTFIPYQGEILPFSDNFFDFLISSHVLEHISKNKAKHFFKEISRVLKKGGVAIIGTPNRRYCQDLFYYNSDDTKKYRLIIPHEHEYYYDELNKIFKNLNFFSSFSINQTINNLNRELMIKSIDKIKPGVGIVRTLKFNLYSFLRSFSWIQDLMARLGTELMLFTMRVNYEILIAATYYVEKTSEDLGDNFIIIAKK